MRTISIAGPHRLVTDANRNPAGQQEVGKAAIPEDAFRIVRN